MENIDPNILIPALAGILGAVVGAVASFVPNLITDYYRNKREAKKIEASLIVEIKALVEVADARSYQSTLEKICAHLQSKPQGTTYQFTVNVSKEYSRIYQANAHQIGVIQTEQAVDIVRFHQLMDAVVQDVRPGGLLSNGAQLHAFTETEKIFKSALEVGRKLKT